MILISIFLLLQFNLFAYTDPNEFDPGQEPYILQYRANIRSKPNRNSEVIAILNMNVQVEILENSKIGETINDVWGYWYKIKYGNIIGYTFGGNLARQTIVADIDKNGINDYFHYRRSAEVGWDGVNTYSDIIIYLNNERISTQNMHRNRTYYGTYVGNVFDECILINNREKENVIIELFIYHRDYYPLKTVYRVNNDGTIEFLYDYSVEDEKKNR
jgi:hypothetical protein